MQERRTVTSLTAASTQVVGWRRLGVALAVAAVVVAVDQVTKTWALHRLAHGPVTVLGPITLTLSFNTGSAFSLFTGLTALVAIVALALVSVLVVLAWRSPTAGRAALFGLVVGGALGNLSDRLFRSIHGAVVDFIDLKYWPTFNVADACIVVGCVLLVVSTLRTRGTR